MKFHDKGLTARASGLFALANLAVFVLYYIFSYVVAAPYDLVLYLIKFLTQSIDILLPFAAVAIILTRAAFVGRKAALIGAIPFAAVKIVYLLPYYYLHMLFEGYDSIESLVLGLLYSLLEILIYYGIMLLLYAAVLFVQKRTAKRKSDNTLSMKDALLSRDIFDLDNGATLGIFSISLIAFVYLTVKEIINTVSYLIDYAGNYQVGEIIYMAICFIYDLAMLFAVHTVTVIIKNIIISKRLTLYDI